MYFRATFIITSMLFFLALRRCENFVFAPRTPPSCLLNQTSVKNKYIITATNIRNMLSTTSYSESANPIVPNSRWNLVPYTILKYVYTISNIISKKYAGHENETTLLSLSPEIIWWSIIMEDDVSTYVLMDRKYAMPHMRLTVGNSYVLWLGRARGSGPIGADTFIQISFLARCARSSKKSQHA